MINFSASGVVLIVGCGSTTAACTLARDLTKSLWLSTVHQAGKSPVCSCEYRDICKW